MTSIYENKLKKAKRLWLEKKEELAKALEKTHKILYGSLDGDYFEAEEERVRISNEALELESKYKKLLRKNKNL